MFVHSDRLPTGSPLPDGHQTPTPWGLRRMAPYPAIAPAYGRLTLDPATQTGRYYDHNGHVIDMSGPGPGHGTSTGTNPATNTGNPSDGQQGGGDQDTGNDGDQ